MRLSFFPPVSECRKFYSSRRGRGWRDGRTQSLSNLCLGGNCQGWGIPLRKELRSVGGELLSSSNLPDETR